MSDRHDIAAVNPDAGGHARRRWLRIVGLSAAAAACTGLPRVATARTDSATGGTALETVRLLTGYPAGGTSDTICRRVARHLSPGYARAVVVENRTGAGGQIALQALKGMAPDGTTIVQTPSSMLTIYPHIFSKLPYDPARDFTPVSLGCVFDFGLAIGPMVDASVTTLPAFIDWLRRNPDKANYGSPAAGSTPHFIGAILGQRIGLRFEHAAYRGSQPALLDLVGGSIAAVCAPVGDILQHAGKVRFLAVSGASRSRYAPEVPTFVEQGFKDLAFSEWFAFLLPAGAKPAVVRKLQASLHDALASKDVIAGLDTFGLQAMSSTPEELADLLRKDSERWGPIVRSIGFRADS